MHLFWKRWSAVFNPATALALYFIVVSFLRYSALAALERVALLIFIVILPVFGYIHSGVKSGKFKNHDVSDRTERKKLYLVAAVCTGIFMAADRMFTGHFDLSIVFGALLLILMQISNFFIKSSMHTAFNVFCVYLWYKEIPAMSIAWLAVSLLTAYSRIYLGRHSIAEVFSGGLLASAAGFLYLYFIT